METKKYRFDEVTINFDKKRIPLSSAQREKKARHVSLLWCARSDRPC